MNKVSKYLKGGLKMNKKGTSTMVTVLVVLLAFALLGGVGFGVYYLTSGATSQTVVQNANNNGQLGTAGQNPSISYALSDALTSASITASPTNVKDATTGALLGTAPSLASGQKVTYLMNASGYIPQVLTPDYTVVSGNQNLQGTLYKFANETIQIYNNANTGLIGGALGNTGNDSKFTTLANNKIVLTGNPYKSSGRLFVVFEVSNTLNVSQITLSESGSGSPVPSQAVPNCYANNLTGTPYKVAWEVGPIVGGVQKTYNLQTTALNGNYVQGITALTIYSEKDFVDSLNGKFVQTGICDSNNAVNHQDKQVNQWYFQ